MRLRKEESCSSHVERCSPGCRCHIEVSAFLQGWEGGGWPCLKYNSVGMRVTLTFTHLPHREPYSGYPHLDAEFFKLKIPSLLCTSKSESVQDWSMSASAAARNLDAVASHSDDVDLSSQSPNASRARRVRKKTTSDLFLKKQFLRGIISSCSYIKYFSFNYQSFPCAIDHLFSTAAQYGLLHRAGKTNRPPYRRSCEMEHSFL